VAGGCLPNKGYLVEATSIMAFPLAFPSPDGAASPLKFGIAPASKHATHGMRRLIRDKQVPWYWSVLVSEAHALCAAKHPGIHQSCCSLVKRISCCGRETWARIPAATLMFFFLHPLVVPFVCPTHAEYKEKQKIVIFVCSEVVQFSCVDE
jgi:hypothetical protein